VVLAKLRSKRELMGYSLADVAKRTGMTRSNLCRLEQNGDSAKLDTLQRYAAALGCELIVEVRPSATS
jgi:transcriptional regulator with XRE-family HTH domain